MSRVRWPAFLGRALAVWLAISSTAWAQPRPYIGYAYPAGGQQGTTFQVRIGGQGPDNVLKALISGTGAKARILEFHRRLNPQEVQLLREQIRELRSAAATGSAAAIGQGGKTQAH